LSLKPIIHFSRNSNISMDTVQVSHDERISNKTTIYQQQNPPDVNSNVTLEVCTNFFFRLSFLVAARNYRARYHRIWRNSTS
jgi:hypothetical protein